MARALLRFLKLNILCVGLLVAGVYTPAVGQAAGDIAFVGVNDNDKNITLVALSDLPANTTVYITDVPWDGNHFRQGGATVAWHAGAGSIASGTIIRMRNLSSFRAHVNRGSVEKQGSRTLSLDGVLWAYVKQDIKSRPPRFLAAISTDRSFFNGVHGTLEGTGLTAGEEAIVLDDPAAVAHYAGDRQGHSRERFLQLIADTEVNWIYSREQAANKSPALIPFSVQQPGAVAKADSLLSVRSFLAQKGWQSFSSPARHQVSFGQLMGDIRTLRSPGSDYFGRSPVLLGWNESKGRFIYPRFADDYPMAGQGYFIYRPDSYRMSPSQRRAAEQLLRRNQLSSGIVNVPVSATDANDNGRIDGNEGFNLLGNPFARPLSVEKVTQALQKVSPDVSPYVYLWNPYRGNGNGGFEAFAADTAIAPYKAYWVRYLNQNVNGVLRLDPVALTTDEESWPVAKTGRRFELQLGYKDQFDRYELELREEGQIEEDHLDAYKLFSLNDSSANLFSQTPGNNRLATNVLPADLNERLEIPLSYTAPDWPSLSFRWERADTWPRSWELFLVDHRQNRTIDLQTEGRYTFTPESKPKKNTLQEEHPQPQFLNNWETERFDSRFSLIIDPTGRDIQQAAEEQKQSTSLKPNYPNPFARVTNIPFELTERTEVTLTIWNMIGQKVATLVDDIRGPKDENIERWDASNMPSGMYIARLEVGGEVFTRKMTLIK